MVTVLLAGMVGCAGSKSPEGSGFVHWEESVAEDNPKLLPTFETLARGYGCKVQSTETSVVGLCGQEGDIVLRKDGRAVVVGCKRVDGLHACKALFGRIVDKPGS